MPPAPRTGSSAAWLSAAVGALLLGAALLYKWHVDRQNAEALAHAKDTIVYDRPPIHYGEAPDSLPARLPAATRKPEDEFDDARRDAETLADQGEFAAALDALDTLAAKFPKRSSDLDGARSEIDALVSAACEEAEARARADPVKGVDALDELAGRVPAAEAARLGELRDRLKATAARDAAGKRLEDADRAEKEGRLEDAVDALLEAARGLSGDASERSLARAARLLQRVRYDGAVDPGRLAKIPLATLDKVERAVEAALAAGEGKPLEDALLQLEALPDADPELVSAVILRGGTPLDAPAGERVVEHALPGGEKRRYAVSVPEGGLPTRPRPLVLFLEPGAGTPEGARGVARGWRQALGDAAIVAVGLPDAEAGWGPNRKGEEHVGALLADLRKRYLFDPDRVVLAGKSAGAHGVWFQAMRYGDRFSACVAVAGTPYAPMYGSHWIDWIGNLTIAPARALVGVKDDVFAVTYARRFAEIAREKACRVEVIEAPDRAHEGATAEDVRKAVAWALEQRRDPRPRKVSWSTDNPANGRCAWIEIAELSRDAGQLTVNFVNDFGATVESRRIAKECAHVEASAEGQRVVINAVRVAKLRVLWCEGVVDTARPVVVVVNGKEAWKGTPSVSAAFAIREARRTGRRDRVFPGGIDLDVP